MTSEFTQDFIRNPTGMRNNPALVLNADFRPLSYETKLRLFRLLDPAIASRMNVKQLTEYMDAMQGHFLPMGIRLTDPEARKYEAMQ